jgi:hypothetical protein
LGNPRELRLDANHSGVDEFVVHVNNTARFERPIPVCYDRRKSGIIDYNGRDPAMGGNR